jgi:hypothetical protein
VIVAESGDNADHPTNNDAAPPRPLNNATISGIEVIATARAATAPMAPPTNIPATIQVKSTMPWSSKAATMATSIPRAENILPRRAVAGEPNIFKPKMKSPDATTYPS